MTFLTGDRYPIHREDSFPNKDFFDFTDLFKIYSNKSLNPSAGVDYDQVENDKETIFYIDARGFNRDDIEITVLKSKIKITGNSKYKLPDNIVYNKIKRFESFSLVFDCGFMPKAVKAELKPTEILEIVVEKPDEVLPSTIEIK